MNECVCWHASLLHMSLQLVCVLFFTSHEFIQGFTELNVETEWREININVNVFLYCLGWKRWFSLIFMHRNIYEIYEVRQITTQRIIYVLLMSSSDCNHESAVSLNDDMSTVNSHFPRTTYSAEKKTEAALTNSWFWFTSTLFHTLSCCHPLLFLPSCLQSFPSSPLSRILFSWKFWVCLQKHRRCADKTHGYLTCRVTGRNNLHLETHTAVVVRG